MIRFYFLLAFIFTYTADIFAQAPANDACAGAVTLPQNGSCLTGTTLNSGDNWVGQVGCQNGNHNEVWYSFNSTGTLGQFTVSNGTQGGNVEFILVSSTGPCTGLGIVNSTCGPSPLNVSVALTPGTVYYVTISSTGANGTFNLCLTTTSPPPAPGQNCSNASILCNSSTFSQSTSNSGFGTQEVSTTNSCWGSGGERQSKWFKFSVGCTGPLMFNANPVTSSNDYDWAVWNITGDPAGCTTKGSAVACNWSACKGSTGMSSCPATEPGVLSSGAGCAGSPAAWVNSTASTYTPLTVTAGNVYALLIDNFSTSNSGFTLTFGGACGGGVVLGPDAAFTFAYSGSNNCTVTTTKTCAISPTTNSTYLWTWGDGTSSTTMNASHTYAATGTYIITYMVTDLLGCSRTTSQTVTPCLIALPIELLSFAAKDAGDGSIILNWTTATEKDIDYYSVERSLDANNFTWIGNLDSKSIEGSSNSFLSYSFIDADAPVNQEVYYRLSHVNRITGEKISVGITSATATGELGGLQLIPNPANSEVQMNFYSYANSVGEYVIYDFSGKPVLNNTVNCMRGVNGITADLSSIPSGFYVVSIKVGNKSYQSKLVKR